MAIISLIFGVPVIVEFFKTRYITKIPSAVLASGCMILAVVLEQCGLMLDTVVKINKENYEQNLLRYKQLEDMKKNK